MVVLFYLGLLYFWLGCNIILYQQLLELTWQLQTFHKPTPSLNFSIEFIATYEEAFVNFFLKKSLSKELKTFK